MKNYTQFVTESVAPLSLRDFPITSHIDIGKGRSAEEILTHFFDVINPALQNSQIIKAQLKTIRDYASQIVDIGFRNISDRYVVGGKWKELPEVLQQYSMYGAEPMAITTTCGNSDCDGLLEIGHCYTCGWDSRYDSY
jgi:precorrin-6B methylase 2